MKLWDSIDDMTDEWLEGLDPERDLEGQLIFYTSLFEHSDGSIHDQPEGEG